MIVFLPFIKTIIIFSSKYSDKGTVLCTGTGFMCGPMATKNEERKQQQNERQEADIFFLQNSTPIPYLQRSNPKIRNRYLQLKEKSFSSEKKTVLKTKEYLEGDT